MRVYCVERRCEETNELFSYKMFIDGDKSRAYCSQMNIKSKRNYTVIPRIVSDYLIGAVESKSYANKEADDMFARDRINELEQASMETSEHLEQ